MKPLAVDLCCGLGGWSHGLLAEGWDVVGFDVERHVYGNDHYPAQLVLQDILTIDGRQFRGKVSLVVASPPCQFFSYTAMPWTRAKKLAAEVRTDPVRLAKELALFNACVRIGSEAECPIVIENVRGAQKWVGRARWMYGSFALWGDVPALMPITQQIKVGRNFHQFEKTGIPSASFHGAPHEKSVQRAEGIKQGGEWWHDPNGLRALSSRSNARKQASAMIAKIPFELAQYIARVFKPQEADEEGLEKSRCNSFSLVVSSIWYWL